jgi:putative flavoprotein involved in K+ transport
MTTDEMVAPLEHYSKLFSLPLREDVQVTSLERARGSKGYLIEANGAILQANRVVVATGAFPFPKVPQISAKFPQNILQMHTNQYRNPSELPQGSILVV